MPTGTPAATTECGGCGLLQRVPALAPGLAAECERCGSALWRSRRDPIGRSLALTATSLVLMLILCLTTLMTVETAGITLTAGLFSGPAELVRRGLASVGLVVIFTTVVAPIARMLGTLYVLIRLRAARPAAHLRTVFVWVERLAPWSMIDVFVFGVFVAYVKLGDLVTLHLGIGVYALLALTCALIWADTALGHHAVWEALDPRHPTGIARDHAVAARTPPARLIGCETCALVQAVRSPGAACLRCGVRLHARKPDSVARTWALLIAAAVLYVPANLYPVLTVVQLGAGAPSTIFGGVRELIGAGQYPLAALVFFASIAVPMLKLIGLAVMLIATQTGRGEWLRDRTRLYHFIRWIGRWSMIDIFMEALLGALVRFGAVVTIEPGFGALAFCAVVILTMIAAECFDPRLMWDAAAGAGARGARGVDRQRPSGATQGRA